VEPRAAAATRGLPAGRRPQRQRDHRQLHRGERRGPRRRGDGRADRHQRVRATPIRGTLILRNVIDHEQIDVAVKTGALVTAQLNSFAAPIGVANLGTTGMDATENYWGCAGGPGASGCATAGSHVTADPWLHAPFAGTDDGTGWASSGHDGDKH
jgi:hypothetical protein